MLSLNRKILTSLIIALTISTLYAGKVAETSSNSSSQQVAANSVAEYNINQHVKIESLEGKLQLTSEKADWDTRLPWIVAAIISLVTILISLWQTRSAQKQAKKNELSNEKQADRAYNLANEQLKKTIETAKEQIATDLKIASQTLNAQVLSKNRQDWINELRELIAQFLCAVTDFRSEWANQMNNGSHFNENDLVVSLKTKMNYTAYKIELMLNPEEEDTKSVIALLNSINSDLMASSASKLKESIDELKKVVKTKLKHEWNRVKECR